eukprot:4872762-Amphidinium_carterae.1
MAPPIHAQIHGKGGDYNAWSTQCNMSKNDIRLEVCLAARSSCRTKSEHEGPWVFLRRPWLDVRGQAV